MSAVPSGRSAWAKARRLLPVVALLGPLGAMANDGERRAGDILATALPVGTLVAEWARGDQDGATQFALSFALTVGSAEALKRVTGVERPDGSNDLSFPSGHAARAFSSAAYVRARHGLMPALPLYAAATYVGHTRVQARRHRWGDVLGAALLAEASAHWLVSRRPDAPVTVSLGFDDDGVHAQLNARW